MRLKKDFGVRALLALIALAGFELVIFVIVALLFFLGTLNVETALAIIGLGQSPAMLALGFYFGNKISIPQDSGATTTPVSGDIPPITEPIAAPPK